MRAPRLALFLTCVVAPLPLHAESFELLNGDTLSGAVVERDDRRVVLEHEVLGRLEIPVDQIEPPEGPNPGLLGTAFLEGWTRTFHFGLSGSDGNTDDNNLFAALDLDFADEGKRWAFDLAYRYEESFGSKTKHEGSAVLVRDWLVSGSPWFTFAGGHFDYDEFQSWRYRVGANGGVGYEFLATERFELRGRTGPSLVQEFDRDEFRVEALVGLEGVWRLSETHSVEASNTVYPGLDDLGEYRNRSRLAWKWRLSEDPGLSLNAGLDNEYQSDVASGRRHNDLKYFTTLGVDF